MTMRVQGVPAVADFVFLRNGRAQVGLFFVGAPAAFPRDEMLRLAKVTAGRMAKAMRGA
jgi:hypothetical protein